MQYFFDSLVGRVKERELEEFTSVTTQTIQGELAQTGERSLCMREAPGSIPGFSTSYTGWMERAQI